MKHIFDLSGKVAAVIGGASGIGEAVTIGAAKLGATVNAGESATRPLDDKKVLRGNAGSLVSPARE